MLAVLPMFRNSVSQIVCTHPHVLQTLHVHTRASVLYMGKVTSAGCQLSAVLLFRKLFPIFIDVICCIFRALSTPNIYVAIS